MTSTVDVTRRPHHHGLTSGFDGVEQEVEWGPTVKGVLARYVILTAIVTGLGLALVHLDALSGLRNADLDVSQWFLDRRTPGLDTFAQFWSTFADTITICAVDRKSTRL